MTAVNTTESRAMRTPLLTVVCVALWVSAVGLAAAPPESTTPASQSVAAATRYLEGRVGFWQTWPSAQRDHDTACVSCHTVLPYAMARPIMQRTPGAFTNSPADQRMLANISKRVQLWNEVEPFYPDQTRGIPKTSESRGTESVLNAFILSARDAGAGRLGDDTRTAFDHMWALQMRTGPTAGGWTWLNFGLEPWEAPTSTYFGASLAAIAIGRAPGGYATEPAIQPQVAALTAYLHAGSTSQSLYNQLLMLWASSALPGIVEASTGTAIVNAALARQNADGGWSMRALAPFARVDQTPLDDTSDGYATALTTLALLEGGTPSSTPAIQKARTWLTAHQDAKTGAVPATSVNKRRDPATEPAKFMTDAATGLTILALAHD